MLRDRVVFIGMPIDDDVANIVVGQLLRLASESSAPITIHVNSPGGAVAPAFAILDAMARLPIVQTCVVGQAAGMAALIVASGTPGRRYALQSSRIALSRIRGAPRATRTDEQATEMTQLGRELRMRWNGRTTLPKMVLDDALAGERVFGADEAVAAGLVDSIYSRR